MTQCVEKARWCYGAGMSSPPPVESLRERTRRAVRGELIEASQKLFGEHGYDAVTVDQIAAEVGMSRRSFFRYFSSKEDVILGKYERQGEVFAEALRARPVDEGDWAALRRMFDGVVAYVEGADGSRSVNEMDRVISSSSVLRAGFVERMQRAQELVVQELAAREGRRGELVRSDVARAALVSAAFAALTVAHVHSQTSHGSLAAALDEAMGALIDLER
jgi:AcrR family transcriptional regulator